MTIPIEMKTRYIIFTVLALLVTSFAAHAQGSEVESKNPNGLYMTKTVTANPDVLNNWTLQLESFVTGIKAPADLDVVLVLDRSTSMSNIDNGYSDTRLNYLKSAANAFVDQLYDVNSTGKFRMSIIQYSSQYTSKDKEHSKIVRELTEINSDHKQDLHDAINSLTADGGTYMSSGLMLAYNHLSDPTFARKCLKYVIVLTDGMPVGDSPAHPENQNNNQDIHNRYSEIDSCTQYSYQLKNNLNAKIYSIGLCLSEGKQIVDEYGSKNFTHVTVGDYLKAVSSDYLKVYRLYKPSDNKPYWANINNKKTDPNPLDPNPDGIEYLTFTTKPDELTKIFKDIGEAISQAEIHLTTPATTVVDKIADDFRLPKAALDQSGNINPEFIKMYAVACNGHHEIEKDGKKVKVYHFDEANPIELPTKGSYTEQKFDTVKVVGKGKEMTFSGFDFEKNFVLSDDKGYQGYKFVVKIPIVADPASVGGCNLPTNTEESGIYHYDSGQNEQIGWFPINHIDLPNIIVVKKGLKKGESAIFKVSRIDAPESVNPIVVVATQEGESGDAMAIIKLQQPGKYKVEETSWSWAYTSQGSTSITKDVPAAEEKTVGGYTGTVFEFTNNPKENTPAHAESNTNNVFFEVN